MRFIPNLVLHRDFSNFCQHFSPPFLPLKLTLNFNTPAFTLLHDVQVDDLKGMVKLVISYILTARVFQRLRWAILLLCLSFSHFIETENGKGYAILI